MTLGPIVDGLRVVRSGLKAGEPVVVNGLQRIRPGAPVTPLVVPMGGASTQADVERYGRNNSDDATAVYELRVAMNFSSFFIARPIFAVVLSLLIVVGRRAGAAAAADQRISRRSLPPTVVVRAAYPGANPKVIAETVASPLEQQMNGVEGMLYMFSQADIRRRA